MSTVVNYCSIVGRCCSAWEKFIWLIDPVPYSVTYSFQYIVVTFAQLSRCIFWCILGFCSSRLIESWIRNFVLAVNLNVLFCHLLS